MAEGDLIAGPISRLLDSFDLVVGTRDWHPPTTAPSLASTWIRRIGRGTDPPSIWPVHCVRGTPGAELYRVSTARSSTTSTKAWIDGARAIPPSTAPGWVSFFMRTAFDRVFVVGLTTEYCVKNTVLDARGLGLDVVVVEDAIRPVEVQPGDAERALAEMEAAGASFARSADVKRARAAA